jgi:hypothetical protein
LSHRLYVFASAEPGFFALLQSRSQEVRARFFGSSLEERFMYAAHACFATFPFPPSWNADARLEAIGERYYDFRAALVVQNDEGLTKTYNRFHEADQASPDILRLRALHDAMDRAVLDAYGWTDLRPTREFLLDYEDDDSARAKKRKKPWRYRWSDDFRDAVLARLLALNKERLEPQRLTGQSWSAVRPTERRRFLKMGWAE